MTLGLREFLPSRDPKEDIFTGATRFAPKALLPPEPRGGGGTLSVLIIKYVTFLQSALTSFAGGLAEDIAAQSFLKVRFPLEPSRGRGPPSLRAPIRGSFT